MNQLPADKKYPIEYSNEEIIDKINSQSKYLMKKDLTPAAAAKYSGRMSIGILELQGRKQKELNDTILNLNKSILLLGKVSSDLSKKQLNYLKVLDESINELRGETNSLSGITEQQSFKLDMLFEAIESLKNENEKFRVLSANTSKSSSRLNLFSIILVIISIIFSGFAVFYSSKDFTGDKEWEKKQIEALNNINSSINSLQNSYEKNSTVLDSFLSKPNDIK